MASDGASPGTWGPLPVRPRLDAKPWGGRRLAAFGFDLPPAEAIGEALITAAEAVVAAGPLAGRTLGELAAANPAAVGGARGLAVTGGRSVFPLLIKIIDAGANLSIQVHPDDAGATRHGPGSLGKTEAWVVLAAEPGGVIYAGIAPGCSMEGLSDVVRAERGGTAALLRQLPARPGETLLLPAGTVHALGAGIVVYEVQQPSEITYRLDDWGRVDAAGNRRQMHVEEGLAAVDPRLIPEPIPPIAIPAAAGARELLAACRFFALERLTLPAGDSIRLDAVGTPRVLTCLSGEGIITTNGAEAALPIGGTVVVPAAVENGELHVMSPTVVLRAWVPDLVADVIAPARAAGAAEVAIVALGGPSPDVRLAMREQQA